MFGATLGESTDRLITAREDSTAPETVALTLSASVPTRRRRPDLVARIPRGRKRLVFLQLFRFVATQFGRGAAARLMQLHDMAIEPGESRLQAASVGHALRFVARERWPLPEMFKAPAGYLQLVWQLGKPEKQVKLVARFSDRARVSFALVGPDGIRLAGEADVMGFADAVAHLRPRREREEIIAESNHEIARAFFSATTEQYRGAVLPSGGSGRAGESQWCVVSAESTR